MDLKSTWTTLLDLNSFYDKLYLESKIIRHILLDLGLGFAKLIKQAGMLLQKYEDFLELSVKQSTLISLGRIMCCA